MNDTDLFGRIGPGQRSLFGEGENRMPNPEPVAHLPNPEDIRRRVHAVLDQARAAKSMPWDERKARMWQTVFPQMTKWLPDDERDQLCFEFAQEMERLKKAA